MTAHRQAATARSASDTASSADNPHDDCAVDALLELLSDAYACRLLCVLDDGPLSADALVDRCEMSRPTVYRRLDRLTDVGLVEARQSVSPMGTHRRVFRRTPATVEFHVSETGVDGTVRTDSDGD
jgi:DNA-binding HxlR family transcriptional regulator